MVRTSQCFYTESSQPDGTPTLAAAEVFPYSLVPPAFLIADRGVYPLDLSLRHKWHFLVWSFRFACMDACQFICSALVSPISAAKHASSRAASSIWKAAMRGNV